MGRQEGLEIVFVKNEEEGIPADPHRGRAERACQKGHLAEQVAFLKAADGVFRPFLVADEDLHLPLTDQVERVSEIALMENDLPFRVFFGLQEVDQVFQLCLAEGGKEACSAQEGGCVFPIHFFIQAGGDLIEKHRYFIGDAGPLK